MAYKRCGISGEVGTQAGTSTVVLPLAAADLFAYSAYRQEVGPIGIPTKPTKSERSYRGNAFRIEIRRETLDALHEQAIMFASERPQV